MAMSSTDCTKLFWIHWLTLFLSISDRVTFFCYNLRCCETSFLTSNVSFLKDEIRLAVSHFTVIEACGRS